MKQLRKSILHRIYRHATLESHLKQGTGTGTSCGCKSQADPSKYATIRNILKNTDSFGNDIEEVDQFAYRCGKIYCNEVDKYMNPRGGQFQAGITQYPLTYCSVKT